MEPVNPFEGIKTYDSYGRLLGLTLFVFFLQVLAATLAYAAGNIFGFELPGMEAFLPSMLVSIWACWAALAGLGVSWRGALADWNAKALPDAAKTCKYFGGYLLLVAVMAAAAIVFVKVSGLGSGVFGSGPAEAEAVMEEAATGRLRFLLHLFVVCALTPVAEELLFRRILFTALRARKGFWASALISGLAFALFHGKTALLVFPVGVYLCWVYEKERRLPVNILLHGLINLSVTVFKTLA